MTTACPVPLAFPAKSRYNKTYVAFLKDTSEFIGTCSVGPEGAENEWGFGYCVAMAHWGHGYATEMAKAMMDLVYQRGVRDFHCTVAVENAASARVMEKCGLQVDHESSFEKRGTGVVYRSYIYRGHLE